MTDYERNVDYRLLSAGLKGFAEEDPWFATLLPNAAALIYDTLPDLNWAGFYLMREGGLSVGPFIGKPACIHIPLGKGVCGTAAAEDAVQLVPDVHQFPGHIACDSASNSEIVIPVHDREDGSVIGVLDIDSVSFSRFSSVEKEELEEVVKVFEEYLPNMR